jgi:hypothetical protein
MNHVGVICLQLTKFDSLRDCFRLCEMLPSQNRFFSLGGNILNRLQMSSKPFSEDPKSAVVHINPKNTVQNYADSKAPFCWAATRWYNVVEGEKMFIKNVRKLCETRRTSKSLRVSKIFQLWKSGSFKSISEFLSEIRPIIRIISPTAWRWPTQLLIITPLARATQSPGENPLTMRNTHRLSRKTEWEKVLSRIFQAGEERRR